MRKNKSDLSVSGNITIEGTPTDPNHAATKDYVDSAAPQPTAPDLENDVIASRVFI